MVNINSPHELENWKVSVSGIIIKENKILAVQQNPNSNHRLRGCWRLPTGKMKSFEHPYDAVKREILEESSIEAIVDSSPIHIKVRDLNDSTCNGLLVVYYEGKPLFNVDVPHHAPNGETIDACYFDVEDFFKCAGALGRRELEGKVTDRIYELMGR